MTKIKVCGIKQIIEVDRIADLGVDYIGLIMHPGSKRYISKQQAFDLANRINKTNSTAVAVFVNHDATAMQEIITTCDITTVQLHGAVSKSQHQNLPEYISRIYVISINANGAAVNFNPSELDALNPQRDYIFLPSIPQKYVLSNPPSPSRNQRNR